MGKPKAPRRVDENSAIARSWAIRSSARKLNLVAASIRGMKVSDALTALRFTPRRIANEVRKVLQTAVANAENNHALDVDKLVVTQASVGRSFVMKRWHARGRGRSSGIEKPFSNLTIVVSAREVAEKPKKAKNESGAKKPAKKSKTAKAEPAAAQEAGA